MSDEKKAAAPIIIIRPRRTNRYCGQCGKVIALRDKQCKSCGAPIDWSVYRKKHTASAGDGQLPPAEAET